MGQRYDDQAEIDVLRDIESRVNALWEAVSKPRLVQVRTIQGTPTAYWSDGSVYIRDVASGRWSYDGEIRGPHDES